MSFVLPGGAEQQIRSVFADLIAAAGAVGDVRDDITPAELAR
ncbi:MAG: hypothetical protein WKF79_06340 [Nocardioides sp.]